MLHAHQALKIPYEFNLVDALKGETNKTPFLKINPAGLVPCIVDEHGVLGESGAILQYLCESKAPDAAVAALWSDRSCARLVIAVKVCESFA